MPTTKQRINITPSPDMEWAIKKLAKRDKVSVSAKVVNLLEEALEIEEDLIWAEIAEQRSREKVKYIPHETVWKNLK